MLRGSRSSPVSVELRPVVYPAKATSRNQATAKANIDPVPLQSLLKLFVIFMLPSRAFLSLAVRRLSSRPTPIMNASSGLIPADAPLEEEGNPDYDPRRFYPARVGDTIQKYQILSKLGWGTGSTVWLAKDNSRSVQHPS